MKNNMLKVLAMRAKNRMMNKGCGETLCDARIKIINNDDAEFVDRVRKLLEEDGFTANPLKQLMDEKRVNKLDELRKERYLLETMEKYLKAKTQIESEQSRFLNII